MRFVVYFDIKCTFLIPKYEIAAIGEPIAAFFHFTVISALLNQQQPQPLLLLLHPQPQSD